VSRLDYVRSVVTIDEVRKKLAEHRPATLPEPPQSQAAVAMVLRERAKSLELLFIERASREGDPWSGHMAMPGGRVDPGDSSAQAAAARETWEEVGLSLDGAEFLGRLDDIQGLPATARQLTVSAYVFHIETSPPLLLNHEVREAFWFPVASLMDPELHVDHPAQRGSRTHFPGILVGEPGRHVVWGLTYRFLEHFFEIVERPLPERWRFDEAP
jgi:8-oxo-dGTP pyrophosphatase MutT (NUDIX family)